MFPPANAIILKNEAGEPIGWDVPSYDRPEEMDPYRQQELDQMWEYFWDMAEGEICTGDCDYPCEEHHQQLVDRTRQLMEEE